MSWEVERKRRRKLLMINITKYEECRSEFGQLFPISVLPQTQGSWEVS